MASSSSDDFEEALDERAVVLPGASDAELGLEAYEDGDDEVTSFVEPPPSEPKWLVQVTPFDRRSMSPTRVRAELRRGELVHPSTLVWRGGMQSWLPIAHVPDFGGEAPAPAPLSARALPTAPPRSRRAMGAAASPASTSPASTSPASASAVWMSAGPASSRRSLAPLAISRAVLRLAPQPRPTPLLPAGSGRFVSVSGAAALAAGAASVLVAAAATLALLAWGGAFEAGRASHPTHVLSLTPQSD